jgi:glycosyltransferase involved in cell wall biosynthesis
VHAVIADSAERFAGAVVGLLSDPQQAATLARDGAAYVRSRFGWDRAAERFIDLITAPRTATAANDHH